MKGVFDVESLRAVCAAWPKNRLSNIVAEDKLLERIRGALHRWLDHDVAMSASDLTVLLRQVMVRERLRGFGADLMVPISGGWPTQEEWRLAGVTSARAGANLLHVTAEVPRLRFLGGGADLYDDAYCELESHVAQRVEIDPFMEDAFGYSFYTSPGQREAIRALFLLPQGFTLLANLPTGSGKSALAQAPILCEGWQGSLTVVIVPTVALALDQARRMNGLLVGRYPTRAWNALAYHGDLSDGEKVAIRDSIRSGTQGIVFTSPESVGSGLAPALELAAKNGFLKYFVIDEAHLVVSWGDGFRLGFQSLTGQRRALLKCCGDRPFKTVLASATMTADVIDQLRNMFGPPEMTETIASVHLRPEPRYWYFKAQDAREQESLVLQAVRCAPRPLILYATTRDQVERWANALSKDGYLRLARFHGGTADAERARILEDWSEGSLDIVVANSAFGLGVDKDDIRTVIHATIPEGLDRFYQEVGRGGRDGAACTSLTIWTGSDIDIAQKLSLTKLIGDEYGFERWRYLVGSVAHSPNENGILTLDLDTLVPRLEQESRGNRDWNIHTVLLMARAGLLELLTGSSETAHDEYGNAYPTCRVRILDARHSNEAHWIEVVEVSRVKSNARGQRALSMLLDVLNGRQEIAKQLVALYSSSLAGASVPVTECCGGCPQHWQERAESVRYRPPEAAIATSIRKEDLRNWLALVPAARERRLYVPYGMSDPSDGTLARVIEAVLRNCPLHEVVLEGQLPDTLVLNTRLAMKRQMRPMFIEVIGKLMPPSFQFRCDTVRLSIVGSNVARPACLTECETAAKYEVVLFPVNQPDPFHPLREYLATAPRYVYAAELLGVLTA